MIETFLAGLVVAICVVLLARLLVGERRRYRFDAALQRLWRGIRRHAHAVWHWRDSRRNAQRLADEAIRRAREGDWDGNVYKPKSFKRPPRNKMH